MEIDKNGWTKLVVESSAPVQLIQLHTVQPPYRVCLSNSVVQALVCSCS